MTQNTSTSETAVSTITANTPGSVGAMIEEAKRRRVLSGHPADREQAVVSEITETAVPEPEPEPESAAQPPTGEKPDDSGRAEEWGFTPKYKSHREAEIGYREAERKMHEATQAAAAAKAEAEQLRRELEQLKEQLNTVLPAAEEPAATTEDPLVSAYENALARISDLDPFDPDYHKKAARIWASTGLDKILLEKAIREVEQRLQKNFLPQETPAATAAPPPQAPAAAAEDTRQRLITMAEDLARKAGLDMTPGSLDHRLFWSNLNYLPDGLSFQEEVQWMIRETQRLKPKAANPETIHREHAVLERGSDATIQTARPKTPSTISEMLERHMQKRII